MKFKPKYFYLFLIVLVSVVAFSQFSLKQDPIIAIKDSIRKSAELDSLKLASNLKLKLFKENAHASYYADKFTGRKTASGQRFYNNKYTAAHRKLPFGTKVKVTNLANNKFVVVEITDRGPFTKGRDIDLTKKAFMEIASGKYGGSMRVKIEEIIK
jgi:rare lipoprotein A